MGNAFKRKLKQSLAKDFLTFDKFIQKKMGVAGNAENAPHEAYLEFRRRTDRAEIASRPTMRRWFGIGEFHRPSREHVIHMCFALHLSAGEAQEYLQKGVSEPGFQVNDYQEFIFMYGLNNGCSYEECLVMMEQFEQNFDRQIYFSQESHTKELQFEFAKRKNSTQEDILLWMSDHAEWFKGYSQTTLECLIHFRKVILEAVRKEQEERLRYMLEEIGYYKWLAAHPSQTESRESIRYYMRRIHQHMKENVLELMQVVYQEKDTNSFIVREIFEVDKGKQGDWHRNYGNTGQIRRITNKYLSDLFSIPFQRERANWVLGAIRRLQRLPAEMACPAEINESLQQYFRFPPFTTAGEALERLLHEKKEQKRRCVVIQRSDILPLLLHASQYDYRKKYKDKQYNAQEAKKYFVEFANTVLAVCSMTPINPLYELDTALLACFQPEEMYGYPDILEALGR